MPDTVVRGAPVVASPVAQDPALLASNTSQQAMKSFENLWQNALNNAVNLSFSHFLCYLEYLLKRHMINLTL
jgi:hypothetical protein